MEGEGERLPSNRPVTKEREKDACNLPDALERSEVNVRYLGRTIGIIG